MVGEEIYKLALEQISLVVPGTIVGGFFWGWQRRKLIALGIGAATLYSLAMVAGMSFDQYLGWIPSSLVVWAIKVGLVALCTLCGGRTGIWIAQCFKEAKKNE